MATPPGPDPVLVGTPEFEAAAHERCAQLRARAPVHRVRMPDGSQGSWLVVGYEPARDALAHPQLSKGRSRQLGKGSRTPAAD